MHDSFDLQNNLVPWAGIKCRTLIFPSGCQANQESRQIRLNKACIM